MTRVKVNAFEDGADAANDGDVWVRNKAHVDGGAWQAPAAGGQAYPIGAVFISVVSTNPNTLLGYGTWSAFGAGRVMVGLDAGDTDFDLVEETGGAKTASHTHGAGTLTTDTITSHSHTAGTLAPSTHSGTAVDAHSGTAVDAHAAHTHAVGTLATSAHSGTAVANHGAHAHFIDSAGFATISAHSGTAVTAHPSHVHGILKANLPSHAHTILASVFTHQHGQMVRNTGTAGTAGTQGASTADLTTVGVTASWTPGTNKATELEGNAGNCYTEIQVDTGGGALTLSHSVTQPSAHTLGGKTEGETSPLTHSVTQPSAHTLSGATDNPSASLTHSVTQPSNHVVTQPSAHTMSGSTGTDGAHGHNVNAGATASGGGSIVQPYIVCYFWKRTA